ncbi:MAG: hypothetical protein GY730_07365, partial [bacterium]|nr:hypothetical protein [bacterium]
HSYFTETSSDTDVYTIIADKLKERTIYLYKAMSLELLKAVEDSFINDMGETILYHELGHGIIQHKILPVTSGSIGEASRIYGENIMTALLEVLADIAPDCDNISGPLLNIFKNSLTDRIRASRMYYMYLSDTWFFDTDDEYMYIYSDIISLILLKLINPDGSVRFNELSELCDINNQESILKFLVDNMIIISRKIEDITRDAVFCVDGKKFDYNALKIKIKTGLKNDYPEIIDDTYLFHVGCWNLVMEHTRDYSDKREELESCFELEKQRVMKELFIKIAGSDTARNYRYDNRKYLADTLLKINI